jgi:hypothetical protein
LIGQLQKFFAFTEKVTRQQAICMFYCVEYNETNVKRLEKRVNGMEDVDICQENDPEMPVLVSLPGFYTTFPSLS